MLPRPVFRKATYFKLTCLWLGLVSPVRADEDPFAAGVRTTDPLPPVEQRAHFKLPPGFEIQLVATEPEINKPMNLAFDATGRLWVTTSIEYPWPAPTNRPGRDRVMIFDDFGPDGRARKVTTFAEGLNIPIGVYPFRNADKKWKALVWSIPYIWLLEDTDGDGKADKRTPLYGPFDHTRDTHGNQASFRRGFDGWLYATHGFNNDSHVTAPDGSHVDLNSGNTYRIRLDGSHIEHHTHGQVNPFGLAWDPWGDLYSSDCHSAPVYQLLAGGFYPSFGKPHDGLGFAPTMIEHAHGSTAIDGLVYVADDLWPAEYRDNVFIGNVMTSRLNRDRLEWIGATPKAVEMPDFLTTTDPWFRPVDDCFGPDGALYIADFYNRIIGHYEVPLTHPGRDRERGRIWRIVPTGAPLRPRALADDLPGLIGELGSGSLNRRLLAGAEIVDRFGVSASAALDAAALKGDNAFARIHASALRRQLPGGETSGDSLLTSTDPQQRLHGLRRLGEGTRPDAAAVARKFLTDAHPRVVRVAVEVLGKFPEFENVRPLLELRAKVPAADTHLTYVVRKALRDQLKSTAVFEKVVAAQWSPGETRYLGDVVLAVASPAAGAFLVRNLAHLGFDREGLLAALQHAARYAPEGDLSQLATLAREHGDLTTQLSLFNSVDQGLRQRGVALPSVLQEWGAGLVGQLLNRPEPTAGWFNTALPTAPTAVTWDFEERSFADGQRGRVLSSLPGGEALTGVLRSPEFAAPAALSFWLCGHDGYPDKPEQKRNAVRLRAADSGEVLFTAWPPRSDVGQRIAWNLAALSGRRVFLEVTDGDTGAAYAWLALGRMEPASVPFPTTGLRSGATPVATAANLASRLQLVSHAPRFRAEARRVDADGESRTAAAKAALALDAAAALPELIPLFQSPTTAPALRESLGTLLAEQNVPAARAAVVAALKTASDRVQKNWGLALTGNRDGAEVFLKAVEDGNASARLLQLAGARNRLRTANPMDWEARVARLTKDLPPADEARDKLIAARRVAYQAAATAAARPAEGRAIFEKNCALCHRIGTTGALVGPQLDGIGNRGLDRLCEDVLDPNRNVDHAFYTTSITLKDGESVSGLFRREEGELIVLANGLGQEFTVPKREVKERTEIPLSPMPDNFGEALPAEAFNQLLAFLLNQTGR